MCLPDGFVKKNQVVIAGTDSCGWTRKAKEMFDVEDPESEFRYVDCNKVPDNEYCKDVEGFPTFKTRENEICFLGFSEDKEDVKKKCKPIQ